MTLPIVYICHATRYSLVNLLPLLHLGSEQTAEVIILIGAGDPPTPQDRINGIDPAKRLMDLIHRYMPNIKTIKSIAHPPDADILWRNELSDIRNSTANKKIIYNVTGGTTGMTVAGFMGAVLDRPRSQGIEPRVIVYRSHPNRLVELSPSTGDVEMITKTLLPLDGYLELHGYERVLTSREQKRLQIAESRIIFTRRLGELLHSLEDADLYAALRILNRTPDVVSIERQGNKEIALYSSQQLQEFGREPRGPRQWPFLGELRRLVREEGATLGMTLTNDGGIVFDNADSRHYLKGIWFEEFLWDLTCKIFKNDTNAQIVFPLKLRLPSRSKVKRAEVHDIDLAIYRSNQLHIIECKVASYGRSEDQWGLTNKDAARLKGIRDQLVGPYGVGALINLKPHPAQGEVEAHVKNLEDWCRMAGLDFKVGRKGVGELLDSLRKL